MHYFWFASLTGELSFTGSRLERIPLHGLLWCSGRRSVKVRLKGLFVWAGPVWESETASIEPCDATQNGGTGHVDYEPDHAGCLWFIFRASFSTNGITPNKCSLKAGLLRPSKSFVFLHLFLFHFWQKHTHNVSQWVATNRQLLLQAVLRSMASLNSSPTAAALESLTGKCKQCFHDNGAAQQTLALSSYEVKEKWKGTKCGCPFAQPLWASRWRRPVEGHPDRIVKYVWSFWIRYSHWN